MRSWASSLALHGAVLGGFALAWMEPDTLREAMPERWQVTFAVPEQEEPERPTRQPSSEPARQTVAPILPAELPPPSPSTPQAAVAEPPAPMAVPAPMPMAYTPTPTARVEHVAPAPVQMPTAALPPPVPQPDTAEDAERRWQKYLLDRMRALKRYPLAARRLGQEGVVVLVARVGADGHLEGAEVKQGSGSPLLDRDAVRLLEIAAELARDQFRPERPTRLEIPIAYRLEI